MKNSLYLFCLVLIFFSCRTTKLTSEIALKAMPDPPGTIPIADNLFLDHAEVDNLDYLEFMYWIINIYGKNSAEFKKAIPDTNSWSRLGIEYAHKDSYYLNHPSYRNYPVVGVSYEQAQAYCQWRSDRVMEYILISYGIIKWEPKHSKDSVFTIEKYFNGEFKGNQPSPYFRYYPVYSLPDSETFYKAALFADSMNARCYKNCRKKYSDNKFLLEPLCLENIKGRESVRLYGPDPTMSESFAVAKRDYISHLKGNVREMTSTKGVFYGLSYKDSCNVNYNACRKDTNLTNCYTGFRCICTYKKREP